MKWEDYIYAITGMMIPLAVFITNFQLYGYPQLYLEWVRSGLLVVLIVVGFALGLIIDIAVFKAEIVENPLESDSISESDKLNEPC